MDSASSLREHGDFFMESLSSKLIVSDLTTTFITVPFLMMGFSCHP